MNQMISTEGKTTVVIGATGRQGGPVARHLLTDGWTVRALTRKPEGKKAAALRQLGAEVVRADLNQPASLDAAFKDAYGVYNMQAPVPGRIEVEIRQGKNVAEAARRAGIRHIVYGSAGLGNIKTGIEQWDAKIEVTQAMKDLELPLTTLRPVAFMELMTDPSYFPNASAWYIWPKLTGSDYKIAWISVEDVGAIAAKAFANPENYIGRDLPLVA
ncbi:MAG TPA: NmrA/HSCARG family protein, partial [Anaerolineales bacterium]|nr:NmrA/HSCARG family protein [Anaerolineales bacterium]